MASGGQHGREQQADGSGSVDQDVGTVAEPAGVHPVHDARQRLHQRSDLVGKVGVETMRAGFDKPLWNPNVLGKRPVEVLKVPAQVLAARRAVRAPAAGRRVGHYDAVSRTGTRSPQAPNSSTEPCELVPERRRNLEHPWMSAPPEHLHVRPAGGSRPNPHQQLPLTGRGQGLFPYLDMLGAEQVYDPVFHVHGGGVASGSSRRST